jgi:hypothetical protein
MRAFSANLVEHIYGKGNCTLSYTNRLSPNFLNIQKKNASFFTFYLSWGTGLGSLLSGFPQLNCYVSLLLLIILRFLLRFGVGHL